MAELILAIVSGVASAFLGVYGGWSQSDEDVASISARLELVKKGVKAVFAPLLRSLGEAVIGLIPIATPYAVHKFSGFNIEVTKCISNINKCATESGYSYDEINIVTVVFSGLALMSLFPIGKLGRAMIFTAMTYMVALLELVLIVFSSILYAMASEGIANGNGYMSWALLGSALAGAFYLTAEEAWLEAIKAP